MTTFALIHGAWGSGWHWSPLTAELARMGHAVVAPDLPCDDVDATFDDYADVVLDALKDVRDEVVVVGFSLGGCVAPLVAARRPVERLVYLAAFVPEPAVSYADQARRGDAMLLPEYAAGVGRDELRRQVWKDFDVYHAVSAHDVEEPVARERYRRQRPQATEVFRSPCSLIAQPTVPTTYILCADDRLMDNSFWRRAVPERLGVEPVELPGSHTPMASRPAELALLLTASG